MSPIPLAQLADADAFYEQRDSRMQIDSTLSKIGPTRVALVVPEDAVCSGLGTEIALFWTASIIRRMGRPFANLIIATSDRFRDSPSRLASASAVTVQKLVTQELLGADPFVPVDWRTVGGADLRDAAYVIWLGTPPISTPFRNVYAINAFGWVALLQSLAATELSLTAEDFDAAPASIIFAACMAAARIFSASLGTMFSPETIAVALDTGEVTADLRRYQDWIINGSGRTDSSAVPWKGDAVTKPALENLLIVSAGGIGGNFCHVLGLSHASVGSATVVEPDAFDVSNLNRAIGVSVEHALAGVPKGLFAAEALARCTRERAFVQSSYESWISEEIAATFRAENAAVIVGVDQIRTRLNVGSDWPSLLINGATTGTAFAASAHVPSSGGCLGCWYGRSDASFADTRAPMACAAGAAAPIQQPQPVASYSFVSVAAAAQMVAILCCAVFRGREAYAGSLRQMSLRTPLNGSMLTLGISERCLLLCAEPYLQRFFGREAS